jgi:hypothetical protein
MDGTIAVDDDLRRLNYCRHINIAATATKPIIAGRATAAPAAAGEGRAPEKTASSWVKMHEISVGVSADE